MRNVAVLMPATVRPFELAGVCTAVFTLAAAGLLDDRTVATGLGHASQLTGWFPRVRVDPAARFMADDPVSAALLRQHFQRRFGCSPTQYRTRFALSSPR